MFKPFANVFVLIILLASFSILVIRRWRINIITLAVQYLAVFLLITMSWPASLAVIKLIVGWMLCAVLGITCLSLKNMDDDSDRELIASYFFRGIAGLLITVVVISLVPSTQAILPESVSVQIIRGSLVLISMGLLQLGMTTKPLYVIIGLLTFISGFELLYSALEVSTLLEGLLAGINLGLALVGAYFLVMQEQAESA